MPTKSKQEIESHYFELFSKGYPLPDGQVKYGDRPDVIVEGTRRVGIEVTNFFMERGELPESEQRQRSIREDVLENARQRYLDNGGRLIEIFFSFKKNQPIRNKEKEKLISKIVNLARSIETFKTGVISEQLLNGIPELSYVYLNSELYSDPKWRTCQVYDGQVMYVDRLKEILREKEEKAKNYSKCDAYWLLVVIDFINRAVDQEIPYAGVKLKSDVFEKIIVYKTVFNNVLEIKG